MNYIPSADVVLFVVVLLMDVGVVAVVGVVWLVTVLAVPKIC